MLIARLGGTMLNLSIPEHILPLRNKVLNFIEQEVYPVEHELTEDKVGSRRGEVMKRLMDTAKAEGLWALGHPCLLYTSPSPRDRG